MLHGLSLKTEQIVKRNRPVGHAHNCNERGKEVTYVIPEKSDQRETDDPP